jgi:hypothetical protein
MLQFSAKAPRANIKMSRLTENGPIFILELRLLYLNGNSLKDLSHRADERPQNHQTQEAHSMEQCRLQRTLLVYHEELRTLSLQLS